MERSLAEKSYQYIREMLSRGELAPGKRLVNRTLAEEIGVSVIPVREAIRRLASEGLIEHIPGAGAFVREPNRRNLDNLYVLRDALESCAAAEAARNITQDQLQELEYLLECFRDLAQQIRKQRSGHGSKKQQDQWLDYERQFHELLVEASRNDLLAKVVRDNLAIANVFDAQRGDPNLLTFGVADETCKSKAKLLKAIRDRDPEQARQLMSQQIRRGHKVVTEYFNQKRRNGT